MLHFSAMQRGKCFNRRHRRRLPQSPPLSRLLCVRVCMCVCVCVSVCVSHTCQWCANCRVPTASDFWFRLWSVWHVALLLRPSLSLPLSPRCCCHCLSLSVASCTFCIIFEHFSKVLPICLPPKWGAAQSKTIAWITKAFHTFQSNLGEKRMQLGIHSEMCRKISGRNRLINALCGDACNLWKGWLWVILCFHYGLQL